MPHEWNICNLKTENLIVRAPFSLGLLHQANPDHSGLQASFYFFD